MPIGSFVHTCYQHRGALAAGEVDEQLRAESEARGLSVYYICHELPKLIKQAGPIHGHTCTKSGGAFCGNTAADCSSGAGPPTPHDINRPVLQEHGKLLRCPRDGELGAAFVDYVAVETPEHVGQAMRMLSYTWGYTIDQVCFALLHTCEVKHAYTHGHARTCAHMQIGTALEFYCEQEGLDPKKTFVWICFACINQHRVTGNNRLSVPLYHHLEPIPYPCRCNSRNNRSGELATRI